MKRTLLTLYIACCAAAAQAQDMAARFVAMPDSLLPLMTKVNREDCVDFLESHMAAKVKNRFDGQTEMTALTSDYLRIAMTDISTVEMKLLPMPDSSVVTCMVTTVSTPVPDSHIRFFDAQWQEIPAEGLLEMPVEDAFYVPTDTLTDELVSLRRKAEMYFVRADLSADDHSLTFTYTSPQYLAKEDREALDPWLTKEPVRYEFEEGYFKRK
jgi:hypothetical protein